MDQYVRDFDLSGHQHALVWSIHEMFSVSARETKRIQKWFDEVLLNQFGVLAEHVLMGIDQLPGELDLIQQDRSSRGRDGFQDLLGDVVGHLLLLSVVAYS